MAESNSEKLDRVAQIVYGVLSKHSDYRGLSDQQIIDRYQDLAPELENLLKASRDTDRLFSTGPQPGDLIEEKFKLLRELGAGGMGVVFLANDLRVDQEVALKFLNGSQKGHMAQLADELKTARPISSEFVNQLYELHEHNGQPYVSMEFVEGQTLAYAIRSAGQISPRRVRKLAVQICQGLHKFHSKGIIHRDLKPENLMIDSNGDIRIMDFGLAVNTTVGRTKYPEAGTKLYMAPEQLNGEFSARSDIYSLGLVLYEALTGIHPFQSYIYKGEYWHEAYVQSPKVHQPMVDRHLEHLVLNCLEPAPENRPKSVFEILKCLGQESRVSPPEPTLETRTPARSSRRYRAIALLLATILGLYVVVRTAGSTRLIEQSGHEKSAAQLEVKATDIIEMMGFEKHPDKRSGARGYRYDDKFFRNTPEFAERLCSFWYREAAQPLVPRRSASGRDGMLARTTYDDPPMYDDQMVGVRLRPDGRLIEFLAVLRTVSNLKNGKTRGGIEHVGKAKNGEIEHPFEEVELSLVQLFDQAGLDCESAKTSAGSVSAPSRFDWSKIWTCKTDGGRSVRVEGATLGNRVTWFRVVDPLPGTAKAERFRAVGSVMDAAIAIVILVSAIFAYMRGRFESARYSVTDREVAFRTAIIVGSARMLAFAFSGIDWLDLKELQHSALLAASNALLWATTTYIFYCVLEPTMRRYSGKQLNTWNQLLRGPLKADVGRDILIGTTAAALLTAVLGPFNAEFRAMFDLPARFSLPFPTSLDTLADAKLQYVVICEAIVNGVYSGFALLLLPHILRTLVEAATSHLPQRYRGPKQEQKYSLAAAWLLVTTFLTFYYGEPSSTVFFWFIYMGIWVFFFLAVTRRPGILASIVMLTSLHILFVSPITSEQHLWYYSTGMIAIFAVGLLGLLGFVLTLRATRSGSAVPAIP